MHFILIDNIEKNGWKIVSQQYITQNILPFLGYCDMLTKRNLLPIVDYIIDSIQEKKPWIYFLFEDSINALKGNMAKNAKQIDPNIFSQELKYMLIIMKKG